jgi:hypothetical protein
MRHDLTQNDGYLYMTTPISLSLGDVFTLKAATYTLAANSLPPGFNPQAQQSFTGNMFLINVSGVRLSGDSSAGPVPEPGSTMLGALAGLSLLRRRR